MLTQLKHIILSVALLPAFVTPSGLAQVQDQPVQEEQKEDVEDLTETESLKHSADKIKEEIKQEEVDKSKIDDSKEQVEQQFREAQTLKEKYFAEMNLSIENYRLGLRQQSSEWLTQLSSVISKYESISQKLDAYELNVVRIEELQGEELKKSFFDINSLWRTLLDDSLSIYRLYFKVSQMAGLPKFTADKLSRLSAKERGRLEVMLDTAKDERDQIREKTIASILDRFDEFYQLLQRSSVLRSQMLETYYQSTGSTFSSGSQHLKDIVRECLAIPFRFFGAGFTKYLQIQSHLNEGFWGLLKVAKSLFGIFFLFLLPFVARRITGKLRHVLDERRKALLNERSLSKRQQAQQQAVWIQRIIPYTPWLLYFLILKWLEGQLKDSFLHEISFILPLFMYFIAYRMFRLLVGDILSSLQKYVDQSLRNTKELVHTTTRSVGLFFLISFSILYLTHITVERGILYRYISLAMLVLGVVVCCAAVRKWRHYLIPAGRKVLPEKIAQYLIVPCESKWQSWVYAPLLLIALLVKILMDTLQEWLFQLEISKRFLAKIFRRKVEAIENVNKVQVERKVSDEYSQLFADEEGLQKDMQVLAHEKPYQKIVSEVSEWLEGKEEDQSIAVHGEKGIGKTQLLQRVVKEFSEQVDVISVKLPPKVWQESTLHAFFVKSLGLENEDNLMKGVLEFHKKLKRKTLIVIDDAHNLFLGRYGGFEALHTFIDIVNLKTENMFWISAFNEYSWAYLKAVMGSSRYLRTEVALKEWSDEKVRELILKRHAQSELQLSYDSIALATSSNMSRSEAVDYAEEQFFRLLWEQASGNPRVALFLWLKSLHQVDSKKLRVYLPERPYSENLSKLNDTAWFVLAAVARHENLTRNEAVSVVNIAWPQVAHALKLGIENRLIYRDGQRYRLHFLYQYDVLRQLRMKNYIYGN